MNVYNINVRIKRILFFILLILSVTSIVWHISSINKFNNEIHEVTGNISKEDTYFEFVNRDLATSSWVKRDYDLYGSNVDLTAITYDGTLYNNGSNLLDNWTLKVNITKDCFINQLWNGSIELHQIVYGRDVKQNINLASYNLDDLYVKYLYDGDLLIPLHKGDYFIYKPSEKFKETEIEKNESITIGGIFYFLNEMELTDYTLMYHYHKSYHEGTSFIISIIIISLFLLYVFALFVERATYKRVKKDMEMKHKIEYQEMQIKAKSSFLANMSHEIRTPINTIIGLDTMILRENKDPETKKYAKEIKNASNILLSLINGVLDSSKMEAGKMELIPDQYSLKLLIFDVRSITKTAMETKNLDYVIDISKTIPDKLYGDDVRLKQIIINLLTNATKYTKEGKVVLSIKDEIVDNRLKMYVSVKDTGMGIKEEDIEKLTEGYQRLDEKKNRNIEGTGLGLELVKGILKLMDSKLEVESTYGVGSNFFFTIMQDIVDPEPIGDIDFNSVDVSEDETYASSFIASDAKVLVVDDNMMNLMVFEKLLKDTKVNITKASSGKEALELTKKEKFDIIYMDHMMPEMDGIECFNRIKKQEDGLNCDTVVIVLTANALQGAKEEYIKIGFNDFLQKPIEPDMLESLTLNYLPKEKIEKQFAKKEANKNLDLSKVNIDGVDLRYGIDHAGSNEGLIDIMKNFLLMAEDDSKELNDYHKHIVIDNNDQKALESYRIKVHAMKSSAGMFGALQVYGAAAFLEKAARENKVSEVLVATPLFLQFWNELKTNVENFIFTLETDTAEKKDVNKENLENLLHQLSTSMKSYDIKNADALMSELEKYNLIGKEEIMKELKLAVSKLEAEKIDDLCDELLK
ncbi:MAG: response regulator [Clostridia bacterium]|nr:response regulator [Clostridia bacterium]